MPEEQLSESIVKQINICNEFKLVAACSWMPKDSLNYLQKDAIVSLCNKNIQWNQVVTLVDRHRIPTLVYTALKRYAAEKVPADFMMQLKQRNNSSRILAMRHAAELVVLLKLFAEQSVEAIPLKGLLLSQQLYNDPCIRHSKDLDILVRPEDIDTVDAILKSQGYTNVFPGFELSERHKRYLHTAIHHFEYHHYKTGLSVEVHWRSFLWTPKQAKGMWIESINRVWMGVDVRTLEQNYQFLYLCDHGAGHKWFRLKWLSDVAMLISSYNPEYDWEELIVTARNLDLLRVLAQTFLLVRLLYGVEIPIKIADLIAYDSKVAVSVTADALKEMLYSESEILNAGKRFESIQRAFYIKKLKQTFPNTMIIKSIMMTPGDFKILPLPSWLFFLYIPLRPFLWFYRHYVVK